MATCNCNIVARQVINDSPLEEAISLKYLGVILSEDLSWGDYVINIMSKTNQRLGLARRIKHFLPLHAWLTLYHYLMLPLFDSGDIICGDKNNATLMNNIFKSNKTRQLKSFLARLNILPRQMLLRS